MKKLKFLTLVGLMATASTAMATNHSKDDVTHFELDKAHTFVTFEIDHFATSTNRGRFDDIFGEVQLNPKEKSGKLNVTIKAKSINTGFKPFTKHLKSEDLFNVKKFPLIHFEGEMFEYSGEKLQSVFGNLTLLGKTNAVVLKANRFNCFTSPVYKKEVCGGDFEATIDRTQFNMNYGVDWGFEKNVKLIIQVEGIKKDPKVEEEKVDFEFPRH